MGADTVPMVTHDEAGTGKIRRPSRSTLIRRRHAVGEDAAAAMVDRMAGSRVRVTLWCPEEDPSRDGVRQRARARKRRVGAHQRSIGCERVRGLGSPLHREMRMTSIELSARVLRWRC